MPDRKAVVAGRFYPGSSDELQALLHDLFTALKDSGLDDNGQEDTPCAVMAPHAGYIFSAPVAASPTAVRSVHSGLSARNRYVR